MCATLLLLSMVGPGLLLIVAVSWYMKPCMVRLLTLAATLIGGAFLHEVSLLQAIIAVTVGLQYRHFILLGQSPVNVPRGY